MKKILKYLKCIGWIIGINLVLSFILTLFHYFDVFSPNTMKTLKLLSVILSMFIGGIYIGRRSNKKGYLEGTKIGLVFIVLILFFTILSKNFSFKALIYSFIILISSVVGAMIGIQKKKD